MAWHGYVPVKKLSGPWFVKYTTVEHWHEWYQTYEEAHARCEQLNAWRKTSN